jgi:hypothetical protein
MITKQALGNTLWGMADILRDKVEDYKAYILTLLFFKRLSDNYQWENEFHVKEAQATYGTLNPRQLEKILAKYRYYTAIMNHTTQFWTTLKSLYPDYKQPVDWIHTGIICNLMGAQAFYLPILRERLACPFLQTGTFAVQNAGKMLALPRHKYEPHRT